MDGIFFSGNSGKKYDGAEVKHEIYFEWPNSKHTVLSTNTLVKHESLVSYKWKTSFQLAWSEMPSQPNIINRTL